MLPCPGERVPLPDPPQPPLVGATPEPPALVSTAPSTEAAWFNQGPPNNLAAGNTNSWLFVPLLHAAVGRLHPSALAAWEAHAHYALLWQGALSTLRQAPPVAPAALVHALHTLQQLAAQEGRALPVPEAQLLLTLAAEANLLPDNTSVHLLWAWQIVTLPDGYIPATVQEALLHVFMGEMAASALLQEVAALHRARAGPPTRAPASTSSGVRASTALQQPPVPSGSASSSSSSSSSTSSTQNDPSGVEHDLPNCEHEPASDTRLRYRASLANLDPFLAEDVLARPCCLFRVPPHFCKGVLRRALHVALDLIRSSARTSGGAGDIHVLHRPASGARVEKPLLLARFQSFMQGIWAALLQDALDREPATSTNHRATEAPDEDARARRARHLAHLGELSAARQALTAAPLAPATDAACQPDSPTT